MVEAPGAELVPEMAENTFSFGEVPEIGGDPSFKPVEAKLRSLVGELLVDGAGPVEDDQGFLGFATVV